MAVQWRGGLVMQLLRDGVPPTLLIDLVNPEGMRTALAAELAEVEALRELREIATLPAPTALRRLA